MDEEPEVPQPVPTIPQGALWLALAIPPVITLIVNLAIGLFSRNGGDAGLSLLVPVVMSLVILVVSFRFHAIVKTRYRGSSLVFLTGAYSLGQIIVCLALWIGSCALFFGPLNLH